MDIPLVFPGDPVLANPVSASLAAIARTFSPDTVPTLPRRLSPSSANVFRSCPKRFYLEKVAGYRGPGSVATVTGTLVHRILESLWQLPVEDRTLDMARTVLCEVWPGVRDLPETVASLADDRSYRGDAAILAKARDLLECYFTLEDVTGESTIEIPFEGPVSGQELHVQARIGDAEFHGFIDRVQTITLPDGRLHRLVVDYKTGKLPRKADYLDDYWFQQLTYAVLLRAQIGVTVAELRLVFLTGRVFTRTVTDADLDVHEAEMSEVWDGVQACNRDARWPGEPTILCGWCPFKSFCLEFQMSGIPDRNR
jgi:putative RecB family exonuclease